MFIFIMTKKNVMLLYKRFPNIATTISLNEFIFYLLDQKSIDFET